MSLVSAVRVWLALLALGTAVSGTDLTAQMVPAATIGGVDGGTPTVDLSDPLYTSSDVEASSAVSLVSSRVALPSEAESSSVREPMGSSAPAGDPGVTRPLPPRSHELRQPRAREGYRMRPLRAVAFGLTASTLGAGAEMAMPLSRTLNWRVGANYVRYDVPFQISGIDYDPGVKYTAGRSTIDWFPHHGAFHISAGALYFRNTIAGSASVVEGGTFTLGDTTYLNSVDDPIRGSASLVYHKRIAPLLLFGFGNILPRSGRHVSVPFEIGGAYLQPPTVLLDLAGTACTSQGCFNAATDSAVRENIAAQQTRFTRNLKPLEVYPIVSMGLACRF